MLEACQTEKDWGKVCDDIKAARGGEYPDDWWAKVNQSGMMDRILSRWGADSKLRVASFNTKAAAMRHLRINPERN